MKESRKYPIARSVTKCCTRYQNLGRCTCLYKPNHCARHMNKNNSQTNEEMAAGKASRSTSYHEKTNKLYLSLRKKEKHMCVILDLYNKKRIRGAILITINSCHTATGGSKIIYKNFALLYLTGLYKETSR